MLLLFVILLSEFDSIGVVDIQAGAGQLSIIFQDMPLLSLVILWYLPDFPLLWSGLHAWCKHSWLHLGWHQHFALQAGWSNLFLFAFFLSSQRPTAQAQEPGPRQACGGQWANIAILRRYRCFSGPPGHEDDHNHGWDQCQYRKDTFRIEQDE